MDQGAGHPLREPRRPSRGEAAKEPNLLTGILFDAHGGRMSPTHANKKGTRYRYYISRSLLEGSARAKSEGQRIPAIALESLVVRRIRDWLAHPAAVLQAAQHAASDAGTQKRLVEAPDILPRVSMNPGPNASAHSCKQPSCASKFMSTVLILYPVHVMTRKSFGLMTRKLSVTESQRSAQFRGTVSRRKPSVASANWAHVA